MAPGKAPASWPNSSLSISVSGQGGAIDGDEGLRRAAADVVQRARRDLLAGAGVADDQHVGVGGGDGAQPVAQVDHGLGAAGQPRLDVVALAGDGAQPPVLEHQPAAVDGARRDVGQRAGR